MIAFDPNPNLRWLFCLAHPDDELTIAAWIAQLVRQGNDVWIHWTHSNRLREVESRAVALGLGVKQDHLIFGEANDGVVCEEMGALLPKFQKLMQDVKPDRVVTTAFEQGHLDHDATNWLVNQSFNGPVFELPLYHTYRHALQTLNRFSDPRGQEIRELDASEKALKINLSRAYPSQSIGAILHWHHWLGVRICRKEPLCTTERMRLQTHFNFRQPNHPPALAAKVAKSESWQRWLRAVRAAEVGEEELVSARVTERLASEL